MKQTKIFSAINLRATHVREQLISLFLGNEGVAFSEAEIDQFFDHSFDRVTIYRTIRTLVEKAVIHKVICEDGVLKYAHKSTVEPVNVHPHFQCTACGQVKCLAAMPEQKIDLPKGYALSGMHMLIKGVCAQCVGVQQ